MDKLAASMKRISSHSNAAGMGQATFQLKELSRALNGLSNVRVNAPHLDHVTRSLMRLSSIKSPTNLAGITSMLRHLNVAAGARGGIANIAKLEADVGRLGAVFRALDRVGHASRIGSVRNSAPGGFDIAKVRESLNIMDQLQQRISRLQTVGKGRVNTSWASDSVKQINTFLTAMRQLETQGGQGLGSVSARLGSLATAMRGIGAAGTGNKLGAAMLQMHQIGPAIRGMDLGGVEPKIATLNNLAAALHKVAASAKQMSGSLPAANKAANAPINQGGGPRLSGGRGGGRWPGYRYGVVDAYAYGAQRRVGYAAVRGTEQAAFAGSDARSYGMLIEDKGKDESKWRRSVESYALTLAGRQYQEVDTASVLKLAYETAVSLTKKEEVTKVLPKLLHAIRGSMITRNLTSDTATGEAVKLFKAAGITNRVMDKDGKSVDEGKLKGFIETYLRAQVMGGREVDANSFLQMIRYARSSNQTLTNDAILRAGIAMTDFRASTFGRGTNAAIKQFTGRANKGQQRVQEKYGLIRGTINDTSGSGKAKFQYDGTTDEKLLRQNPSQWLAKYVLGKGLIDKDGNRKAGFLEQFYSDKLRERPNDKDLDHLRGKSGPELVRSLDSTDITKAISKVMGNQVAQDIAETMVKMQSYYQKQFELAKNKDVSQEKFQTLAEGNLNHVWQSVAKSMESVLQAGVKQLEQPLLSAGSTLATALRGFESVITGKGETTPEQKSAMAKAGLGAAGGAAALLGTGYAAWKTLGPGARLRAAANQQLLAAAALQKAAIAIGGKGVLGDTKSTKSKGGLLSKVPVLAFNPATIAVAIGGAVGVAAASATREQAKVISDRLAADRNAKEAGRLGASDSEVLEVLRRQLSVQQPTTGLGYATSKPSAAERGPKAAILHAEDNQTLAAGSAAARIEAASATAATTAGRIEAVSKIKAAVDDLGSTMKVSAISIGNTFRARGINTKLAAIGGRVDARGTAVTATQNDLNAFLRRHDMGGRIRVDSLRGDQTRSGEAIRTAVQNVLMAISAKRDKITATNHMGDAGGPTTAVARIEAANAQTSTMASRIDAANASIGVAADRANAAGPAIQGALKSGAAAAAGTIAAAGTALGTNAAAAFNANARAPASTTAPSTATVPRPGARLGLTTLNTK